MRKLYSFLTLFLLSLFAIGQNCPTEPIAFTSQAQIDQFIIDYPDCTELPQLVINGGDINNLKALSNLTRITANGFSIINTSNLQSLEGLENLVEIVIPFNEYVGFTIASNSGLEDISALSNAVINDPNGWADFWIKDNPALLSLNGLQGINGKMFQIYILNNDKLVDLQGLTNLKYCEDLILEDNDNLVSLEGLDNLDYIFIFQSRRNNSLIDMTTSVPIDVGNLEIEDNPELRDLGNFQSAEEVSTFGFGPGFKIRNNPQLEVCSNNLVCSAFSETGPEPLSVLVVANNAPGCDTLDEVENLCNPVNQNCLNAVQIRGGKPLDVNNFSFQSVNFPSCYYDGANEVSDTWFTFNSENKQKISVSLKETYNLQLWEGSCDNLKIVADGCGIGQLKGIKVNKNTQYYVQVWSSTSNKKRQDFISLKFDNEFSIFPNPAVDKVTLKADGDLDLKSVEVFTATGKLLSTTYKSEVDFRNFSAGIYFIKITDSEDKQITKKIVKL